MKQGWEIKKLPDVVWFQEGPGVRKHQYTTSGVKLLNVANLVNGKVDLSTSDRYVSEEEAYGKYKHFLADEGDLILASSGIQVEYIEKKMGFVHKEHLPLCMNTSTIRFKPVDKECLNIRYFMYFLKSYNFKAQLYRLITGIAQLNFGPLHLKQMNIPVPSRAEQERIVAELDCLSGVIEKKREQLKQLDALAQSIFYQMFGDPITNEKGWEVKKVKDIFSVKIGPFGSLLHNSDYISGGTPLVNPIHMHNERICPDYDFSVSDNKLKELGNYILHTDDIVLARRGDIGRCAIVGMNEDGYLCGTGSLFIRPITNINSNFIIKQIRCNTMIEHLTSLAKGATMLNINCKIVEELIVILPPLTLQQEFADKIEAIEKQKELIKKSISETETLFNARMDYYFN